MSYKEYNSSSVDDVVNVASVVVVLVNVIDTAVKSFGSCSNSYSCCCCC